jgi:uncharacterized protein YndB with AHSA1/START domain
MDNETAIEPIRRVVTVPLAPESAFALFTGDFARWWPTAYTWAGAALETIGIEPREGGLCFERGPHGFRCDWGRVLAWEPPRRLLFTWQISPQRVPQPDPAQASEVEVVFAPQGDATEVTLAHRHFARHGDGAAGYREGMASPEGWTYILAQYAAAAGN